MQNDRGCFRCYRYCSIGERHRCDGSARPTIFGFLFSGCSSPYVSPACKTLRFCRTNRKNETSDTYRQCGGLRGILSSTVTDPVQFPEISPSISPTIYIRWIEILALISTDNGLLRASRSSNIFTFTLNVHCSVQKKSRGIIDCGTDTENRDEKRVTCGRG